MAPESTVLLSEKQITTHDFVNSLSSVRSLAELLIDHPGLEATDRSRFISIIRDETERLINLMVQLNLSTDNATS